MAARPAAADHELAGAALVVTWTGPTEVVEETKANDDALVGVPIGVVIFPDDLRTVGAGVVTGAAGAPDDTNTESVDRCDIVIQDVGVSTDAERLFVVSARAVFVVE